MYYLKVPLRDLVEYTSRVVEYSESPRNSNRRNRKQDRNFGLFPSIKIETEPNGKYQLRMWWHFMITEKCQDIDWHRTGKFETQNLSDTNPTFRLSPERVVCIWVQSLEIDKVSQKHTRVMKKHPRWVRQSTTSVNSREHSLSSHSGLVTLPWII